MTNPRCSHVENQIVDLVDRFQNWRGYECPYCEIERLEKLRHDDREQNSDIAAGLRGELDAMNRNLNATVQEVERLRAIENAALRVAGTFVKRNNSVDPVAMHKLDFALENQSSAVEPSADVDRLARDRFNEVHRIDPRDLWELQSEAVKDDFRNWVMKRIPDSPQKSTAKVVNCREAGPGRGFCDMCAVGEYEKCRYVAEGRSL